MHYTLHQLQVFLTVTQTESITKAAEELHLTQPAVSIQLRNFQEQFDIPLTEVVGRKLYVSDFGKEIARAAENILNEVYAINYRTLAYRGQLSGRLRISSVSTGKYVMPSFLSGFVRKHPGIDLVLDVTNKARVVESLERNETDFAVVSIIPEHLCTENIPLLPNRLVLAGPPDAEIPKRKFRPSALAGWPLIFRETGSGTRATMEQWLHKNGVQVRKKMELTSNEAVKQAVMAGLGYSVLPLISIRNELKLGQLRVIPVQGFPLQTTWYLLWLKAKSLSPAAAAYLDHVRENKAAITREWLGGENM
jgi:DNA-binding transcriptional LysR family regulator